MSRRYDLDNPNRVLREEANRLFRSAQMASGKYDRADVDVWGATFHGLDQLGYPTSVASACARAAVRAAIAAFYRAERAPARMEPCPDCSEPARRDERDALSCAECGYAEAYRGQNEVTA